MNRRSALFLTMLMGGLIPQTILAQGTARKTSNSSSTANSDSTSGAGRTKTPSNRRAADPEGGASTSAADPDDVPSNFLADAGQQWKTFDIGRYTALDHSQGAPQNAIVEWIFRRTGTLPWHGDKIAVLSAGRTQIRAYNNAKVIEQTAEVVERFTNATSDFLSVRVRFVAAVDTRWRYAIYSKLTPVGSGPQGQQIWTLKADDLAAVVAQMQIYQGFRILTDQKVDMVNGQTLSIKTSEPRGYSGGMARESAGGQGYQPKAEQLEEGITLRLSPLLTFDGDSLDAAIDLTANTVRGLQRTKVIAPREIGPSELTIDVPEVGETRLNQTVKAWPLNQTLVISAGIHPGHLQSKTGFMGMRIPGTMPTGTELLVILDAEASSRPKRTAVRDDDDPPAKPRRKAAPARPADDQDAEPEVRPRRTASDPDRE